MASTDKTRGLEVIEIQGFKFLKIPHKDSFLIFTPSPPYHTGSFKQARYSYSSSIGPRFLYNGQYFRLPFVDETASLINARLYDVQRVGGLRCNRDLQRLFDFDGRKQIWCNHGVLVTKDGMYVQDNPKLSKTRELKFQYPHFVMPGPQISMELGELEKRLQAGDPLVRFVPSGFKTGRQSPRELAKNPGMIAIAGEYGTEVLVKISEKYPREPVFSIPITFSHVGILELASSEQDGEFFIDASNNGHNPNLIISVINENRVLSDEETFVSLDETDSRSFIDDTEPKTARSEDEEPYDSTRFR